MEEEETWQTSFKHISVIKQVCGNVIVGRALIVKNYRRITAEAVKDIGVKRDN